MDAPYLAEAITKTMHKIRESETQQEKTADSNFVGTLLGGGRPVQVREEELIIWDGKGVFDNKDADILRWLMAAGAFDEDAKCSVEALVHRICAGNSNPILPPTNSDTACFVCILHQCVYHMSPIANLNFEHCAWTIH